MKNNVLMDYLAEAEGKVLHRVAGERRPTSAYGIHQKSNPHAEIWRFYKKICQLNKIPCDASNKSNRDRIILAISKDEELLLRERDLAESFYLNEFTNVEVGKQLNDAEFLAVVSITILVGKRWGNRLLQRSIGAKDDGIIGKITISKLKKFKAEKFLDVAQKYLEDINNPKYINGWTNRVNKLRELNKNTKVKNEVKKTNKED